MEVRAEKILTNDDGLDGLKVHLLLGGQAAIELNLRHVAHASLVLVLGLVVTIVSLDWEIELLAPTEEPEPIVVGIDGVVGSMADLSEAGDVLVIQEESDHLIHL